MTIPAGPPASAAERARLHAAARQLETLVLKELVRASRAFTGGEGAGSAIRADLFADALADAMARGGGLGLAGRIEQGLDPAARTRHGPLDGRLTRHEGVDRGAAEGTAMPAAAPIRPAPLRSARSVPMAGSTADPDPRRPP